MLIVFWDLPAFNISLFGIGSGPRGITPDSEEMEWYYLLAQYYRYRFPPGPVSDDALRQLTAPTLVTMGEHGHYFDIRAAIARARVLLPICVLQRSFLAAGTSWRPTIRASSMRASCYSCGTPAERRNRFVPGAES